MAIRMPYWSRIAVGALFGVIALLALWPTLGISWVTALVAALLAPIGFLGSYFVVSADRPEEGYEQVLFDKPNTIIAGLMILVFAGAGIGTGFLPGGGPPEPLAPEDYVFGLRAEYQSIYDAWTKEDAGADETLARVDALRLESDRIEKFDLATLPDGPEKANLTAANDAYAFALDKLKACIRVDTRACTDARIAASEGEFALQRFAALAEPAAPAAPEA